MAAPVKRQTMAEATKKPIEPGLLSRAVAGVRYALTGKTPVDWFGPGDPMPPIAQDQAIGRQFDYPVRQNIIMSPRAGENTTFDQLRSVADNCDVLRLAIETRKDQLVKLGWNITPKDEKKTSDSRCDEVIEFFRKPDRIHLWESWIRMLLEDLFVLDAPCVYVRPTLGGKPYSLDLIDGSTIKPLIDDTGRQPQDIDAVAFQQYLKGLPAVDYTNRDMIYMPRNPRTNRLYGMGPVEQVMFTVNIAMRRALHQLQFYTEGNIPEALIGVPETWNPDQIRQFQDYWDSINEGNTAQRRHALFVPGAFKMQETKAGVLADKFDEWLARIVCYAFSLSPQPFVAMMNRSTAETAHDSAIEEGLQPIMQWVKAVHDTIIQERFGYTDLQFSWEQDEVIKPEVKAGIIDKQLRNGTITINEARALDAREPVEGGDEPIIITAQGGVLLKDILNPPEPPPPIVMAHPGLPGAPTPPEGPGGKEKEKEPPPTDKEALGKIKKALPPIDRGRPSIVRLQIKMEKAVRAFLAKQGKAVARQLTDATGKAEEDPEAKARRTLSNLDLDGWDVLAGDIDSLLEEILKDGAFSALAQVGIEDAVDSLVTLVNKQAVEYAEARSAELVGMRWVDGELVENPDAEWAITESTREMLRTDVTMAMSTGMSNDDLADMIENNYAFSEARSMMIARTETAFADVAGNMVGYRESGVVKSKKWIVGGACCELCQELEGVIVDLDDSFPSGGGDGPPLHPNCRCDVSPVVDDKEQEDEGE